MAQTGVNLSKADREARLRLVLQMREQGKTVREIAQHLNVSTFTVDKLRVQAKRLQERQAYPGTIMELETRAYNCARNMGASEKAGREEMAQVLKQAEIANPLGLMGYKNMGRITLKEIEDWVRGDE